MALPYLDNPATLDEMTVQELDGLVAKLNTFLSQQHNAQGGHGAVTADSLTLANGGIFTIQDEDGVPTTLSRTRALGTKFDIKGRPDDSNSFLSVRYKFSADTAFANLVKLGFVGHVGSAKGPGVELVGTGPSHEWAMVNFQLSTGPALVFTDVTSIQRVMCLVWAFNDHYEIRPETFGPDVWLGGQPPGQRYERAYINAVHEQGRPVALGHWQDVAYNAANFMATGGALWGVEAADVVVHRWTVIGQTMHYNLTILGSTVSGASPVELTVALPSGYTVAAPFFATIFFNSTGTNLMGYATSTAGNTAIRFGQLTGATWSVGTNSTNVFVSITFEVTG